MNTCKYCSQELEQRAGASANTAMMRAGKPGIAKGSMRLRGSPQSKRS
ncbi:MAG: hypothetical protein ACRDHW_15580 [Ktedonobacteraceae bacterium]